MLNLRISLGKSNVQELLTSLEKNFDTTEILDEAGALLLNRIRTRFLAETDPEGAKWKPSKAGIKRRSKGGTGTLFNTGKLFHSIQLAGTGPNQRAISTDVPYGKLHQFGLDGNEKRVFLGFNNDDAAIVERLLKLRAKRFSL